MELCLLILAALTCLYLVYTLAEFLIGFNRILNLSHQPPLDRKNLPSISIIFSALNEETAIKPALDSMLSLNYPDFEIIAINDRSSDKTPDILNQYQTQFPDRLRVIHIKDLPEGWLGKNHGLQQGANVAKGEWLLFTDADVLMKPDLLTKTISYVLQNKIDHLTIFEHHLRHTFWLKVIYLGQYVAYSIVLKPWRIRYLWSKRSLGHGSFNLVSRKSYTASSGHTTIAMECFDDLKLGKILKENGFRQDTVDGRDFIEREWYKSLPDMIEGLKKNSFAFRQYRFFSSIRDILLTITFFIWPVISVAISTGTLRSINALNVLLTLLISLYVAKQFRIEKKFAILYPISLSLLLFTVMNSIFAFYKHQGVIWRGTHYSLQELKNKKKPTA